VVSVLMSVADPSPSDSLLRAQLELEAEVGIGRLMPCFRTKSMGFPQQIQVTPALLE
jgi:hypothetical protein